NLTTYTIASAVSENVPAGSSVTFAFSWNIGSAPLGRYVITASYPRLTGQSLLASGGAQLQFRVITLVPPIKVGACPTHIDSHALPLVRAAGFTGTGLVCITTSTTATNCSNSAPSIGPLTVGSALRVGVFINNSKPMGGFEIYVKNDPAFLQPTGVNLGTLIVSPSLTSICVNGSAQTGSCTVGTANGTGVVEDTTITSSGSNECGGIAP